MLEREREKEEERGEGREGRGGERSRPLTITIDDSIENIELRYNIRRGLISPRKRETPGARSYYVAERVTKKDARDTSVSN